MPKEFFTPEVLTTFAGMVAFVTAATQLCKYYVSIDPKWIALLAAVAGQLAVQCFLIKDFSPEGIMLASINIVSVLLASIGAFETLIKPVQRKTEDS